MQKPKEYDETRAGGDFTPIELGGHYLEIKQVSEKKDRNGNPMIVVLFDFAANDRQAGMFTQQFKDDIRPDKKWPNSGTKYIPSEYDGKCTRSFKSFCTAVENSNSGFEVKWGDNFGAQFKGKKVGAVYGIEVDYYNGKVLHKHVLRWFCKIEAVAEASEPEPTESKAYKEYKENGGAADSGDLPDDGFMNVPDGIDDELPFN